MQCMRKRAASSEQWAESRDATPEHEATELLAVPRVDVNGVPVLRNGSERREDAGVGAVQRRHQQVARRLLEEVAPAGQPHRVPVITSVRRCNAVRRCLCLCRLLAAGCRLPAAREMKR